MARKLKIYSQSMGGGNYTQVPTVVLKGQWLKAAGFEIGDYLEIECDGDKITLIKTTPPEPKTTKKSLEEKIKKLDKTQREKLARMIDKL
jgi:hypothetical protein|nr:MAG TPA: Toxin SymE, type I toxin-antitoxin system [Caudoviricetes sp.]